MEDYVILIAKESNWSCHRIWDWNNTRFQLFNSGILYVSVNSDVNLVDCRTFIDKDDLTLIKKCIATFNEMPLEKLICCDGYDGTGWSFTSYDGEGNCLKKSHGYIYDIDVLEQMAKILSSYIPKYSIHEYEDMDSMDILEEGKRNAPKSYYSVSDDEDGDEED